MTDINKVIPLRGNDDAGLTMRDADISGDARLCAWIKAAAGVASALGIEVTIQPNEQGRVTIVARAIRPMPLWDDFSGR